MQSPAAACSISAYSQSLHLPCSTATGKQHDAALRSLCLHIVLWLLLGTWLDNPCLLTHLQHGPHADPATVVYCEEPLCQGQGWHVSGFAKAPSVVGKRQCQQ